MNARAGEGQGRGEEGKVRRVGLGTHLAVRVLACTLKKVVPHSVATALARSVLPVPGGPNISTPFQGRRMPWKYSGIHMGSTTASSRRRFAC